MGKLSFEKLPNAVAQLLEKLENVERLLLAKDNENPPEEDQLLNIKQVAEILCLSVPTIYGLVRHAEIPVCKRGKRLYFVKKDLFDWVKAGRRKTLAEIKGEADAYLLNQEKKGRYE